jgi:hypothetical protein
MRRMSEGMELLLKRREGIDMSIHEEEGRKGSGIGSR